MKAEHKAVIERARLHDVLPSELAHELLVHDLASAALFELRNIKAPFHKLNEGQQQEVIDRITEKAKEATATAISIISSRGSITVPLTVKAVKVEEKRSTLTAVADAKEPNCNSLNAYAGKLCLLVMVPNDYDSGLDFIQPDRDQHEMPLHVSELTGSLFERADSGDDFEGPDPLYQDATEFVIATRRLGPSALQGKFKIGYNRASRLLDAMERAGIITAPEGSGIRQLVEMPADESFERLEQAALEQAPEQLRQAQAEHEALHAQHAASTGKEFGDLSYSEAQQIVVLHGTSVTNAWLQRRIGIDADQATTLLLRLSDDDVIALETEADASIDNTYKVVAGLGDLVME